MTVSGPGNASPGEQRDYLCVEAFLVSVAGAQALATAFQLGLINALGRDRAPPQPSLAATLGLDAMGRRLLLDLLVAHQVIEEDGDGIRLTGAFVDGLKYRDLLEARLEFAWAALPDFMQLLPTLIANPGDFQRRSRLFSLFDYARCVTRSPEDLGRTRRWMRLTTALTRYEAPVCMRHDDFGRYRRMLDVGGNSGEFSPQVCRRHPGIWAVVLDLPVVCDIGRQHVGPEPEATRIAFCEGNAFSDPLPEGCDLVTFKSMLHDWPDREATELVARGCRAVAPRGTVLIFERGPLELSQAPLSYGMLPFLLFAHYFRPPTLYVSQMEAAGLTEIRVQRIELESPFFLVTGRKAVG